MKFFNAVFSNQIFISTFVAWLIAQLLKGIFVIVYEKRVDFSRFVGAGGMPSSHAATVMSLSTAIGLAQGFDSALYAFALVMAIVVMTDATGVRQATSRQARILNEITDLIEHHRKVPREKLQELLGHTRLEVLAGAILGIGVAVVLA